MNDKAIFQTRSVVLRSVNWLVSKVAEKRDSIIPLNAKKATEKFDRLKGVEVLPYPAYSPDNALSD
ncbi:hypothetical protein KIN20_004227 [Parelaphostrongylus tenuis]|uniref:Uncharacterized protein n=1 Tax=Parelaphostrongylus tenuis TaxID=148309 RepID=A0AAD5QGR4_PARTN|nr:hypothetical protein KIN20_004227 [Parelaphostrongylus tenuis]